MIELILFVGCLAWAVTHRPRQFRSRVFDLPRQTVYYWPNGWRLVHGDTGMLSWYHTSEQKDRM